MIRNEANNNSVALSEKLRYRGRPIASRYEYENVENIALSGTGLNRDAIALEP
jgi:hypothetical protein